MTVQQSLVSAPLGAAIRLTIAVACLFLALAGGAAAYASEQTDAVAMVQQVRKSAIALSWAGSAERAAAETATIAAAFDGTQIGRTVLGSYWNGASVREREALIDTLLDAVARGLANRLASSREEDFVVLGTQVLGNGDILVRSQFLRPVRQPTAVDWRIRRCKGKLCIGDVILDGASVTLQRRDQVMAQLAANGGSIPKLIADIREGRL